jgi:hypothetical protein
VKEILNRKRLSCRVRDVFHAASVVGMTHQEIMQRLSETVYAELARTWANGRKVYTFADAAYISGQVDLLFENLYRYDLEFCYIGKDGVRYSTHKDRTPNTDVFYNSGRGHELGDLPSAHFWIRTGKPYNTPTVPNQRHQA